MEYRICSTRGQAFDENEKTLEELVNANIERGFEPIGGVAVRTGASRGAYYLQAMIRRNEDQGGA